jgi:hypothetical protein
MCVIASWRDEMPSTSPNEHAGLQQFGDAPPPTLAFALSPAP